MIRKHVFIKNYVKLLEHQYSENRKILSQIFYIGPVEDPERYSKIHKLIKQQIYIKQMINTGREMQRDYRKNDLL